MSEDRTEAPAPTAPPQPQAWYAGLEGELLGHVQNKGWDKLEMGAAVAAMAQAHREAERRLGVPANELLRLPSKPDDSGWAAVWERLGAPKEAGAYDLTHVKRKDGSDLDEDLTALARETAHRLHLNPDGALDMTRAIVGYLDAGAERQAADAQAVREAEARKLEANWGNMREANAFVARQAIERLGLPVSFGEMLERQVGYADAMETFRKIGMMMQEPGFVSGAGDGRQPPMSREAAADRLSQLQNDPVWFKRFYDGGVAERGEFDRLTRVLAGMGP